MKYYIINDNTIAILPFLKKYSVIYELNNIHIINKCTYSIIKYNCLLYGSTYQGRLKGSEFLLGYNYKSPISINNNIILFPTSSPRLKKCTWLNTNKIINIINLKNGLSKIVFNNKFNLVINSSFYTINNQYLKSILLDKKINKNNAYFV